ncbi:Serine/threonine-protein kinase PrkC [Defluviimonas aquaemixtae]|uniref:non-specific serine/threonine protein kinase n=1 Tax=Albidovulum aquaemixtae TaxID=1542388 RepID=A0A2R8B6R3_9RHOB|nr:serine/threonine-protein kinase [Defluviimonas aquaemixtae]SPH18242.1 Serine/threonine-protein kinase PrkC [Defluviimonas aquaemixtae]
MDNTSNIGVHGHLDPFGDELSPGTELCGGQYTIESYLNSGGFGITYLARDSLGRKIVIKECFPGAICCRTRQMVRLRSKGGEQEFDKILELFEKEARALSELQHPYIVGVHQIFKDNGTAYMALDFIEGSDLLHVIETEPGRLGPGEIKRLLIKVLDAVTYMHEHDILHRDISPDNILLDNDNSPVLIDFGAARESATRVSRVLSKVLTVKDGYSPQEFYLAGSEQAYSSDLYALAATFYHLVSGEAPPSSQVRLAAAAKKLKDPLEPLTTETIKQYDRFFLEAINRCLSIFPAERLQNAREWRDLIDTERRKRRLLEQARNDRDMEARVAQLVQGSERQTQSEPPAAQPAVPPKNTASRPEPSGATDQVAAAAKRKSAPSKKSAFRRVLPKQESHGHMPASSMWKVVPVDDPADDPEIKATKIPEPPNTKFGRFFADSYLFRIFGAARGPMSKEVNR